MNNVLKPLVYEGKEGEVESIAGCSSGFLTILVCSSCYHRIPSTVWLINNRYLLLIILESGKSKILCTWSLVGADFLVHFLLCPHMMEGSLWGLFCKGTGPIP